MIELAVLLAPELAHLIPVPEPVPLSEQVEAGGAREGILTDDRHAFQREIEGDRRYVRARRSAKESAVARAHAEVELDLFARQSVALASCADGLAFCSVELTIADEVDIVLRAKTDRDRYDEALF